MGTVRLVVTPLIQTVIFAFVFYILVRFFGLTLWVWVVVLLALILAAALGRLVRILESVSFPPRGWHVPRGVAVILVYLVSALIFGIGGYVVGRLVINEILGVVAALPATSLQEVIRRNSIVSGLLPPADELAADLRRAATSAIGSTASIFPDLINGIVRFFIVLTLAAFLVIEAGPAMRFWVSLFPRAHHETVRDVTTRIGDTMGRWMLAVGAEMVLMATISGLTAAFFGLPAPALMGILSAFLELMPMLGQQLMVVPAVLLGLTVSQTTALEAAVAYLLIGQFDASILAPMITGRVVRISPLVIIIAIPIGGTLYGVLGAIIAVPVSAALQIVAEQVLLPWLHGLEEPRPTDQGRVLPFNDQENRAS